MPAFNDSVPLTESFASSSLAPRTLYLYRLLRLLPIHVRNTFVPGCPFEFEFVHGFFSYFDARHAIVDGDVDGALSAAEIVVEGEVAVSGWAGNVLFSEG